MSWYQNECPHGFKINRHEPDGPYQVPFADSCGLCEGPAGPASREGS